MVCKHIKIVTTLCAIGAAAYVIMCSGMSFCETGAQEVQNAIVDAAEKAGKAVVTVNTMKFRSSGAVVVDPYGNRDRFLEDFFNEFFGITPRKEYYESGLGSGVIIDPQGYILTNEHVIKNADKIEVTLPDGRKFHAAVKGSDPKSDLAVLKIDSGGSLPFVPLGDSDTIKVGQWAIAIGNPFGFIVGNPQPTVTVGVISAVHRIINPRLTSGEYLGDLIQTDAAINMGNSGGPLINLKGEVIGINEFILSTSGGNQGLGFAIPSNKAKRILDDLKEGRMIEYGWLGIQLQEIDPGLAKQFNLPDTKGALVYSLIPSGPAETGGIMPGDIIVSFNGRQVRSPNELIDGVNNTRAGETASVDVIRDGQRQTLQVKMGGRPQNRDMIAQGAFRRPDTGTTIWRGMTVVGLTKDIARRYQLEESAGVLVVSVEENSAAAKAGIMPGDVIKSINKKDIPDLKSFSIASAKTGRFEALLHTNRGYFVVGE